MYVTKRDGRHEAVQFDKITARIKKLVSPSLPTNQSIDRPIDISTD